jgi:hypothetical protein
MYWAMHLGDVYDRIGRRLEFKRLLSEALLL